MANLKPADSDRFGQLVLGLFPNQGVKLAVCDAINEGAHLVFFTCGLKFYPAVWQIAHPSGDVESFGDVAHRETEADALDVTFVKYLKRDHHLLQKGGYLGAGYCLFV
jgi:hypothetical protein